MNSIHKIRAFYDWQNDQIGVALLQGDHEGRSIALAKPIEFAPLPSPGAFTQPTFGLEPTQAQMLMDQLWACGVRPKEGSGSAGSLAATERHLADMQRLVFGPAKKVGGNG